MEHKIFRLNLASPLFYIPDSWQEPFNCPADGERLFCFALNEAQYRNFEPDGAELLGNLIFSGKAGKEGASIELPAGDYFFAQEKRLLNREEIINMIVEIQKETLWQRFRPADKLYLRYLFEDGNWVTQIFRPYS